MHPPLFLYAVKDTNMCTRPIEQDDKVFACRTCDECIATRRHGWVARAMAEKACHAHTVCLALTYSEDTEVSRQGARMFCYADVRDFMKRLRRSADYAAEKGKWNEKPYVRFLCAGEQGDRKGRCHWHLIIYSNFDVSRLGEFRLRGRLVTERRDMITIGKRKRRLNWRLWPHGYITLQEPDQGGMNYVLSYCLKDQFTHERSEGTMREAKSENFATGLFRMSKRPAIGEDWLMQKLEGLLAKGAVLPSLDMKIPDFHGYWHPNGLFREKLLWGLVALNQRIVWSTGANAPQWNTLLLSCADNEKDLEILNGKKVEEDPRTEDYDFEFRSRENADYRRRRERAARCGSVLPCDTCLGTIDDEALTKLGVERYESEGVWHYRAKDGFGSVSERQETRLGSVNPYCLEKDWKVSRLVFPASPGRSDVKGA